MSESADLTAIPSPSAVIVGMCPNCEKVHILLKRGDEFVYQFVMTDALLSDIINARKEGLDWIKRQPNVKRLGGGKGH